MNTNPHGSGIPGDDDGGGRPRQEPDSQLVHLFSPPTRESQVTTSPAAQVPEQLRLKPTRPPGRVTRKARAFESEIARLRKLGYSLDAIREALADVGVKVSRSTVHRESARACSSSKAATPSETAKPPA